MYSREEMDQVLAVVRQAWQGRAELELPTLLAMAANAGIGWGSSNEELVTFLRELSERFPARVGMEELARGDSFLITTTATKANATNLITLTPRHVAVRRGPDAQPVLWEWSNVTTTDTGEELVVADREGIRHRLGSVQRIEKLREAPPLAPGLARVELGDATYLLALADGSLLLLGHTATKTQQRRREITKDQWRWEEIVSLSPLVLKLPGGRSVELGEIDLAVLVAS